MFRLVILGDSDEGGFKEGGKVTDLFKNGLDQLGFEVSLYQMDFHEMFEEGTTDLEAKFDLAFLRSKCGNSQQPNNYSS